MFIMRQDKVLHADLELIRQLSLLRLPLWSLFHRLLTKLPLRSPLLPNDFPDPEVLASLPSIKKLPPTLYSLTNLPPGLPRFLFFPQLLLPSLFSTILVTALFPLVDGNVHLLNAPQIPHQVLFKASRHECSGCVFPRKEPIVSSRPVQLRGR